MVRPEVRVKPHSTVADGNAPAEALNGSQTLGCSRAQHYRLTPKLGTAQRQRLRGPCSVAVHWTSIVAVIGLTVFPPGGVTITMTWSPVVTLYVEKVLLQV